MTFKRGEKIHGYTLLGEFTSAGNCNWAFAEKDHKQYFMKEFSKITLSSTGSSEDRLMMAKEFNSFFERSRKLMDILNVKSPPGGNLIVAHDVFQFQNKLFKVTEKINDYGINWMQIHEKPLGYRQLFIRTLTHSLKILHDENIVHGDLKPENILIKQTKEGLLLAKLIDFDDSYFSSSPQSPELITGDPNYYSPELGLYIFPYISVALTGKEIQPSELTTKSDIFSLGILFYQYLTGRMPQFGNQYDSFWLAVSAGDKPFLPANDLPNWLISLINLMIQKDPGNRPGISQVFEILKKQNMIADGQQNIQYIQKSERVLKRQY